ncbi:MAG TPA: DUF2341 domain-containing protein, partial [Nevskiaceae bacterium]|nr:DUF2341 domain-containing protein [Nevskiaceae bacterium]
MMPKSRFNSFMSRLLLAAAAATALAPATASAWWNKDWAYRKEITLDAGDKGIKLGEDLHDAPVLIRLHEGVLHFTDTKDDGSDLRFVAGDDKTPLKFHIEKFDAVFNLGFVWVRVPELKKGQQTKLWMYYGNPNATAGDEPAASYDSAQVLDYHFGEKGGMALDTTAYKNNATSAVAIQESGLIGNAAKFDGNTALLLPQTAALNQASGAPMTWSAWIKPAAAEQDAVIYAHFHGGSGLVVGLEKGQPYVRIIDESGQVRQSPPMAAIAANSWHHLALVTSGQATLYLDGAAGPSMPAALPLLDGAASLGGQAVNGGVMAGFRGEIDELEIANVARSAALLALLAVNQGEGDRLVSFGADEAPSSWSSGYVGIILGSVTLDG